MKYIFEEKTAQVKGLKYELPRAEVKPATVSMGSPLMNLIIKCELLETTLILSLSFCSLV